MAWTAEELADPRWQEVRREILRRDEYRCCCCTEAKPLDVHHVRYIEGRKPWEYCQCDLMSLCRDCHTYVHGVLKKYYAASLQKKKAMWRSLLSGAPKIGRIIEHGVFVILEHTDSSEVCTIIHAPSFKTVICPLPPDVAHEKMKREPESLQELKAIIMQGNSRLEPSGA